MSFGTKQHAPPLRPMVLATQTHVNAPAPLASAALPDHELIAGTRDRYFSNAATFSSTSALRRLPQSSETSKLIGILLSTLAVGMCVFGVYYWATGGTLELPRLWA